MRLAAVLLVVAGLAVGGLAFLYRPPTVGRPPGAAPGPRLVWAFEAPEPGAAVAAPLATADAVYLAAVHARGFRLGGAVYALDPATGKRRWAFDRDGDMLPTASSPVLAGGRLIFGEGMHANFVCRVYALDPATGLPAWSFETGDHVEGAPTASGGLVYVPAGNDGLYALDVGTGKPKWNYRADVHVDSTPCVDGGRVYVGSGPSRRFQSQAVVCLNAETGGPLWRTPAPLPAWGSPVVGGGRVFVGLGNGRLTQPALPPEVPAGGLACFDTATGAARWAHPVGDAVFAHPVVVADRVVFGSRDGHLHGVTPEGAAVFRVPLGGPVMAAPAKSPQGVVAVSVPGRIVCVDPADGREVWRYELKSLGCEPHVYASPVVLDRTLYVAAEMRPPGSTNGVVTLFRFELPGTSPCPGTP